MAKLLILQGPPCSGKTTWAESYLQENIKDHIMIVNRDNIRYSIGFGKYTMDHEDEVTRRENDLMEYAANINFDIIQDGTNLNPKTIQKWEKWAKEHNYEIEYKQLYIPYAEAMKRSKARRDSGGLYISKEVMKRFYLKYYEKEFRKEMTDPKIADMEANVQRTLNKNMPLAVIADLDGTLALHNGREPFEWDLVKSDVFDYRVAEMLEAHNTYYGSQIIFLTGRPESVRHSTQLWLDVHGFKNSNYKLFMRDNNDFSHGDDYKRKIYLEQIKPNYNVVGVFEDSQKCINMWREEGVLCFAVANNDY